MSNKKDKITRVGIDFIKELEQIKKKKEELGIDQDCRVSIPMLSNKIIHHADWERIKRDLILFDFKNGVPKNEI